VSQSERKTSSKLLRALQNRALTMGVLWGGAYLLALLLAVTVVAPERFVLHVGDIAKKTITASKDVADEITTKQRRDAAAAQVAVVYYKEDGVADMVMQTLSAVFDQFRNVRQFGETLHQGDQKGGVADTDPATHSATTDKTEVWGSYTQQQFEQAAKLVPLAPLTSAQLRVLLNISENDLEDLYQTLVAGVRTTMAGTIPEGQINDAITNIQELSYSVPTDLWWSVAAPALRACLKPNMVIDQAATEANREKVRADIEPVVFKQGQNIVVAGERVTAPQLAVLEALGLIQGTRFDTELYAGVGLLVALLLAGLLLAIALLWPALLQNIARQTLLLLIALLTLLVCVAFAQINIYLLPMAMGALLATVLLDVRAAISLNVILSAILGVLTLRGGNANSAQAMGVALTGMLGGMVGILAVRKRPFRFKILLSGLYIGLVNASTVLGSGLSSNNDLHIVAITACYAMGGGVIAAVLCVGVQPALEAFFNLLTPAKLLELCNPNQPLLRRLMMEAPGTYHHSMVVANIAEAAAESIGVNALLVRVGAYYHDIGKLKRPGYFKENQMGENPHDHTDPRVSTAIVVAHTRDGVALGQRHRLPQEVLDMIAQHHGDTPVVYFYNKAMQQNGGQPVDIQDFRYEGPRPHTAEAALLMLADTVEAAVRAMQDATPEKIDQAIRRLVRGKAEDGQLDDCPLTFRDLDKICEAFSAVLSGVFHERIEYPAVDIPPGRETSVPVPASAEDAPPAQGGRA
jgi:putative nucleotidyltransferase with HDIG domain